MLRKIIVKYCNTRFSHVLCENFVLQYFTMIVRNKDGSIYGSLGTYVNIIEWISDAEAEKLKEQGY